MFNAIDQDTRKQFALSGSSINLNIPNLNIQIKIP